MGRLAAGVAVIDDLPRRDGFEPGPVRTETGSGGPFAAIEFAKGDRRIRLWLRGESLSVRYDLAEHELDHPTYMRELLGPAGGNHFPAYADDAARSFTALRHDLEHHCRDFRSGDGASFLRCWAAAKDAEGRRGIVRLDRTERELGKAG